jgi:hypothetical protein
MSRALTNPVQSDPVYINHIGILELGDRVPQQEAFTPDCICQDLGRVYVD